VLQNEKFGIWSVTEDWQSSLFAKEFCFPIMPWFCLHSPDPTNIRTLSCP